MKKILLERGKMPEMVTMHQQTSFENKRDGFTRPPMQPPIAEFYALLSYRKRLKSISGCKDRKSQYDLEAVTEEMNFHIRNTHPIPDNKAMILWKYTPEFYTPEQASQCSFTVGQLSPYKLQRLIQFGKTVNLYITNCDFLSEYSRKSCYVKAASALILDIDYYNIPTLAGLSAEDVYTKMLAEVFTPMNLLPSYSIASGKGLYLVFLTETIDLEDNPTNQRLYKLLIDKLISYTLPYGADPSCRDFSRVLRLPTTLNQKVRTLAHIIDFDTVSSSPLKRYTVPELAVLLDVDIATQPVKEKDVPPAKPRIKENPTAIKPFMANRTGGVGTLKTLGAARVKDLLKWLHIRKNSIEGDRNTFFLILSCSLLAYSSEIAAWEYIQNVNKNLVAPQPNGELHTAFLSAAKNHQKRKENKRGYFSYSNKRILSDLGITTEEMQTFATIITPEEKAERKNRHRQKQRRNEQGNTKRQQNRIDKAVLMLELLSKGNTQSQIATLMGVSRQLVSRYLSTEKGAV